jgi:hypothetical protein
VTVEVVSEDGTRPSVRTVGGDSVFVHLSEGMSATWTVKTEAASLERGHLDALKDLVALYAISPGADPHFVAKGLAAIAKAEGKG